MVVVIVVVVVVVIAARLGLDVQVDGGRKMMRNAAKIFFTTASKRQELVDALI